jgi:hypothetical protein
VCRERRPRTVRLWTASAGASYTPLRDNCSLVGIDPHDARDLMRMLRVVLHMLAYGSTLDTLLDIGDSRTLARLIERAGFQSAADLQSTTIESFFCRQRFVHRSERACVFRETTFEGSGWLARMDRSMRYARRREEHSAIP